MNKAVIFCQAPIEVPSVIGLYEQLSVQNKQITIVSLRTDSYIKYFKYINLDAQLIFVPEINLMSVKYLLCPYKLKKEVKNYIAQIDYFDSDIYFTSKYDAQLALYLKYFIQQNLSIIYAGEKDNIWIRKKDAKISLKTIMKFFIEYFYTNQRVKFFPTGNYMYLPEINFDKIKNISILQNHSQIVGTLRKYAFKPKMKENRKKAILFTEPYRNKFQTKENYDTMNIKVVETLKWQGVYIAMKGHPRLGEHPLLTNLVDETIPEYIPSEFIDVNEFDFAIGFVSTALSEAGKHIPSYSVLHLCEIINATEYDYWQTFLDKIGNIKYLENDGELTSILKNN
jgi:hypothetical protein